MGLAFDPVTAAFDLGGKLIDRFFPNPEDKLKAQAAMFQMQQQGELQQITGQMEVNKAEAANTSIFVAGWRPFIGWVCGLALLSDFIVRPLFTWVAALLGHGSVQFPALDLGTLLTLLMGMLGLGSMRTVEKVNGVSAGH